MKAKVSKKAFTLIEILVVLVIIGILLAIITPIFSKVREQARRLQCLNNLRQHGIAWYLYLDDHGEVFVEDPIDNLYLTFGGKAVYAFDGTETAEGERPLNSYLEIYSADDKAALELFHCPNDVKRNPWRDNMTMFEYIGNSYVGNRAILRQGQARMTLSSITLPHSKVYLEMCNLDNRPGHYRERGMLGGGDVFVMVLFVDGHAGGPFLFPHDFRMYDTEAKVLFFSGKPEIP